MLAHTPNQTGIVAGLAGDADDVTYAGDAFVGTPANVSDGISALLNNEVGPEPNAPPSIRYPQELNVSAVGEPGVPELAGMLPPCTAPFRAVSVAGAEIDKVYPVEDNVVTWTVSLATLQRPLFCVVCCIAGKVTDPFDETEIEQLLY